MEVIKQVVYLVLVMCIIYLVFYLLTYRTDQHANLDSPKLKISTPKINLPKVNVDMPDGKIIDVPDQIVEGTRRIISNGGSNGTTRTTRGGHMGNVNTQDSNHDWDRPVITRERSQQTSNAGLSSNKSNARYSGAQLGRRTYSRGGMHGEYEGPLLNGKPEGFGVFRYKRKNDLYIGEYVNGKRHGKGYSFFRSGKIMQRDYFNNNLEREEKVKYRYNVRTITDNGQRGKYEGAMKSSKPHGLGTITYKDGSIYVGWFSRGQKHGNGNLILTNGQVISEEWSDGTLLR